MGHVQAVVTWELGNREKKVEAACKRNVLIMWPEKEGGGR